ncbi:MAG: amidohydrolase family protein [Candidatus Bipolaricaulota bacterium]|nr:amidohydrolase family protein [Candidatus Bipolaricaulota bacterium]
MKKPCTVAAVLGLALAAAFGGAAFTAPATLVLFGGTVVPMTDVGITYEAIAVAGDRILALGTEKEMLALAGPETEMINLEGRTALPGFIDPHAHLLADAPKEGLSIAAAQGQALACGITSAAEMLVRPGELPSFVAAAERGEIRLRTSLYLAYNDLCGNVLGPWYRDYAPFAEIAPLLRIGGVKVFAERSSCGDERAAISFSDALRPLLSPAGAFWYGEDRPLFAASELAAVVRDAAELGFRVAIHAIGDAAVETALAALDFAGGKAQALRPMVLHNLFLRDELLPEFARLGVVAAVESTNACFVDVYDDLLPTLRATLVRRWGDLAATGAHVAADSDWPWCDPGFLSPLLRLANLVSPINASPAYASWEPCKPLPSAQLVSVWQGLRMMTTEAAYALHQEVELGTLEPGKLADLVVLSANPLLASIEELPGIRVWLTILGGKAEWRSETASSRPTP